MSTACGGDTLRAIIKLSESEDPFAGVERDEERHVRANTRKGKTDSLLSAVARLSARGRARGALQIRDACFANQSAAVRQGKAS